MEIGLFTHADVFQQFQTGPIMRVSRSVDAMFSQVAEDKIQRRAESLVGIAAPLMMRRQRDAQLDRRFRLGDEMQAKIADQLAGIRYRPVESPAETRCRAYPAQPAGRFQ